MKRFIALLLALAAVFCLCACSQDSGYKSSKNSASDNENDESNEETEAPEETDPEPVIKDLDMSGVTTIGDVAEIKIVNAYATDDVMPPKPSSFYTHYEASSGEVYIVVVMDVKNTGTSSVKASEIISASLSIGDEEYEALTLVETEEGGSLDRGSSTSINALDTARLYQLYSVPSDAETGNLKLTVIEGEETYSGSFALDSFEDKIETVSVGSVITDDDTISLTIDSISFKNTLYPPRATGYYHYYEAANGKTYLIVKMTVKNLKGTDMKYDSIAGVSCVYNDKYNYSFFTVLEEDGGQDLNGYPSQYAIAPLDQGVVYYLAEVPAEVENGPVEISFYIAGEYYRYEI